jgi:predicted N-formylglutamate amidohydrolase
MGAIVNDDYRREQAILCEDPIIVAMANELKEAIDSGQMTVDELAHPAHSEGQVIAGNLMSTKEYVRRCELAGHTPAHSTIGAVATAVLALATQEG